VHNQSQLNVTNWYRYWSIATDINALHSSIHFH